MKKILAIDDQAPIRETLKDMLSYEGYDVDTAADGPEALQKIETTDFDAIVCDIKMEGMDGLEVMEKARAMKNVMAPFIILTGHGDISTAVEATKRGAFDFIQKPVDLNRLLVSIRNALEHGHLKQENATLTQKVSRKSEIVGSSPAITAMLEDIERVAVTDARVLITGPNGSGKELVARMLHQQSARASIPMVEVNCAAIPSELIESELFGHEKGAFTSAHKARTGKFEQANGGTLFLDEIGDMSLSAQAKVLRALQEHKITRVGSDKEIKVNVRVFAATNKNLREEIERGTFREDLYHRLSVVVIKVPPLKDRLEDIPLLVDRFLEDIAAEYGQAKKQIEPEAIAKLQSYTWSGNIRELRNVVERLVIFCPQTIGREDVARYL